MRFREIHPHREEVQTPPSAVHASQSEEPLELLDLGEVTGSRKTAMRSSLPLEWEPLRAFIEAEKMAQPRQEHAEEFMQRLMPKVEQANVSRQVIQEYRRQTCWSRWAMRTTAAAAILGLLLLAHGQHRDLLSLRGEVRDLRAKVSHLENRIEMQQAGM